MPNAKKKGPQKGEKRKYVREALQSLGLDANFAAASQWIKDKYGVDIAEPTYYGVRREMQLEAAKQGQQDRAGQTSGAAGEATPPCLRCGGILKTASTMFGQAMSPEVFARARQAVTTCDLVLAVGTTLIIEPAGSLCASAVRAGAISSN